MNITNYRGDSNGKKILNHVDMVSTTATVFTFPFDAINTTVHNEGVNSIQITSITPEVTVTPGERYEVTTKINSISIKCNAGNNTISLVAYSDYVSDVEVTGINVSDDTPMPVNMTTALNKDIDSIDVAKMCKGGVVTAHSAIGATTTSTEVDCRGFNSLLVECDVSAIASGNWVIDVQGTMATGGTVGDCYDMTAGATPVKMSTGTINANGKRTYIFRGIPNYIKIKATRTTDGTLTCNVQPLNL